MTTVLRPFQKEAIEILKRPVHLLCIAPTGSGKSLIYETVAENLGLRTLLITPLIALARQQLARFQKKGIPAVLLPAQMPGSIFDESKIKILIASPEAILQSRVNDYLENWKPQFLVVDECHCIWEWGDSFRPAFSKLTDLVEKFSIRRSLWLTATLSHDKRHELERSLPAALKILGGFGLPAGLRIFVKRVPWINRADALLGLFKSKAGAGIVFTQTRDSTERIMRLVSMSGRRVLAYHAGMAREERLSIEHMIENKMVDVVVATSAFGLGMDYSHLRWAVLWQAPPSLLFLTQAIGRVARGSEVTSEAIVFWDDDDFRLIEWMVRGPCGTIASSVDSDEKRSELVNVARFVRSKQCRRADLFTYFEGEPAVKQCGSCDICCIGNIDPAGV